MRACWVQCPSVVSVRWLASWQAGWQVGCASVARLPGCQVASSSTPLPLSAITPAMDSPAGSRLGPSLRAHELSAQPPRSRSGQVPGD